MAANGPKGTKDIDALPIYAKENSCPTDSDEAILKEMVSQ